MIVQFQLPSVVSLPSKKTGKTNNKKVKKSQNIVGSVVNSSVNSIVSSVVEPQLSPGIVIQDPKAQSPVKDSGFKETSRKFSNEQIAQVAKAMKSFKKVLKNHQESSLLSSTVKGSVVSSVVDLTSNDNPSQKVNTKGINRKKNKSNLVK